MTDATLRQTVRDSFFEVHDGRSTDDVVIDDSLNEAFLRLCKKHFPNSTDFELNWLLFNLRKNASLGPVVTKSERQSHDAYLHAAEIAARQLEDRHGTTVDRILCDPKLKREFDAIALQITPDVDAYSVRKAALKLRKGRLLQPELLKRVADWNTEVTKFSAEELQDDPNRIPRTPGIYLIYDNSGYLYIGEASNLRTRVSKHLDHSDRKALARYLWQQGIGNLYVELHAFDSKSNGRLVGPRRAYEASLIKSRNPRFNIQV